MRSTNGTMMTNLKEETLGVLGTYNKSVDDVRWIGTKDGVMPIDDFLKEADLEYDRDYGHNEVRDDLKIVGDDWWMERYIYDGLEKWVFKTFPEKPVNTSPVKLFTEYDGVFDLEI